MTCRSVISNALYKSIPAPPYLLCSAAEISISSASCHVASLAPTPTTPANISGSLHSSIHSPMCLSRMAAHRRYSTGKRERTLYAKGSVAFSGSFARYAEVACCKSFGQSPPASMQFSSCANRCRAWSDRRRHSEGAQQSGPAAVAFAPLQAIIRSRPVISLIWYSVVRR